MTKSRGMRPHVYVGDQYGSLCVVAIGTRASNGRQQWQCRCKCGTVLEVQTYRLLNGHKRSCGCMQRERPNNLRHGHTSKALKAARDPKWRAHCAWLALRQRCSNPRGPDYASYGGRGITYEPRWDSFENFLADMGEPPIGMSLDRIDNDGPYSKANCRWASKEHQMRNRRNSRNFTYNGETKSLAEWGRHLGIGHTGLLARLNRGWSIERVFGTPGATARRVAADAPWSGVLSLPA